MATAEAIAIKQEAATVAQNEVMAGLLARLEAIESALDTLNAHFAETKAPAKAHAKKAE